MSGVSSLQTPIEDSREKKIQNLTEINSKTDHDETLSPAPTLSPKLEAVGPLSSQKGKNNHKNVTSNVKTIYESVKGLELDDKSKRLLEFLDQPVQESQVKDHMQYILRSLKNHSDSTVLFYYKTSDHMNLLDIVEKFQGGYYSMENSDNLKLDIESVFENFYSLFPNDKILLSRAQYHFDYLWNYFFPNLSSRTRKKRIM